MQQNCFKFVSEWPLLSVRISGLETKDSIINITICNVRHFCDQVTDHHSLADSLSIPSSDINSSRASHKIFHILSKPLVHYCVHNYDKLDIFQACGIKTNLRFQWTKSALDAWSVYCLWQQCEIYVLNKSMLYKIVSPLHAFKCFDVQIMYQKKGRGRVSACNVMNQGSY
jgi:hypothetical protein